MTYGCTACMTHGCRWEQTLAKKNPFKRLADLRDDVEEFEVVDELASAIQLADQYCYSNTFIYTQPGNGAPSMVTPPPPPLDHPGARARLLCLRLLRPHLAALGGSASSR
jgi:hypothetical protein